MKWDTFIGRKGGMNNTLVPLKTTTNTNGTTSSSNAQVELNRTPKLDAISPGKKEEKPKVEDQPPAPKQIHHQSDDARQEKTKSLLKGKPIIFVGGGPGMKLIYFNIIQTVFEFLLIKVVVKEHNVKKWLKNMALHTCQPVI